MRALEPSAGTGNLVRAIQAAQETADVVAVGINATLVDGLSELAQECRCDDFLTLGDELGQFGHVVMNTPFDHGSDIEHITYAFRMLKPGGRLVTICANGPRQQEVMGEICSEWIELSTATFKKQGANVNAAIVVLDNLT